MITGSSTFLGHKTNLMAQVFLWPDLMAQNTWLFPEPGCITRAQLILRRSNEMLYSGEIVRASDPLTLLYFHKDCSSSIRWCKAQWQTPLVSPKSYANKPDQHSVWVRAPLSEFQEKQTALDSLLERTVTSSTSEVASTQPELNLLLKQSVTHQ